MSKKRDYGRIERFIWNDPRFHALAPDSKWIFLHLLSSPGSYKLPGLVHATPLTILELLNWIPETNNDFPAAMKRVQLGLGNLVKVRWIEVDTESKLVFIPKAFQHERPDNVRVLMGWYSRLCNSVPPSQLRRAWLYAAQADLAQYLGRDDSRVKLLQTAIRALNALGIESLRLPDLAVVRRFDSIREGEKAERAESSPKEDEQTTSKQGANDEQTGSKPEAKSEEPDKITTESETVPPGYTNPIHSSSSSSSSSNSNSSNKTKKQGAASPPPAAASPPARQKRSKKPTEPPEDFSPRQLEIWKAMCTAKFYVPGGGEQTAWENVPDPVKLARNLGGPGYPAVDTGLIHRLAAWTQENKTKSKKKIGLFLTNRFAASQERGGSRGGGSFKDQPKGRPAATGDLSEKVQNTRK